MLASELHSSGALVNSACPGWVATEMGGPNAPRTVEEGAASVMWAAPHYLMTGRLVVSSATGSRSLGKVENQSYSRRNVYYQTQRILPASICSEAG
jgi:NAD(P)-dependent dehydrogenase (short-subunit alcohol dehydrogenase family)